MTSQTGIVAGTILVGAAQPFFQCTPALLAAAWFGPNERVLATTVAINANQIGIAMSYIVGAYMVKGQYVAKGPSHAVPFSTAPQYRPDGLCDLAAAPFRNKQCSRSMMFVCFR